MDVKITRCVFWILLGIGALALDAFCYLRFHDEIWLGICVALFLFGMAYRIYDEVPCDPKGPTEPARVTTGT